MIPHSSKKDLLALLSNVTKTTTTNDLRRCYRQLNVSPQIVCNSILDSCNIINVNSVSKALDTYLQKLLAIQKKGIPSFPTKNIQGKSEFSIGTDEQTKERSVTQQPVNVAGGSRVSCCVSAENCQYFSIHEPTDITSNNVCENREKDNGNSSPLTNEETYVKRNSSSTIEEDKVLENESDNRTEVRNVEVTSNLSNENALTILPRKTKKINDCDNRPYRCSLCNKAFKRNLHLKRHFLVTHTTSKNYNCNICGRSFSRKDYLDKHVIGHEKKNFKLKLLQQGIVVRTKMCVKTGDEKT